MFEFGQLQLFLMSNLSKYGLLVSVMRKLD